MGQCMQLTVINTHQHPSLGSLIEVEGPSDRYFILTLPLESEEEYMNWSKTINRLRCNAQIRDYLYLPMSENYKKGDSMCEISSKLELTFHPYSETLSQMLLRYRDIHKKFSQMELWYLIYVLTKYIRFHEKIREHPQRLSLQNILINEDDKIKIIPEAILSNFEANTLSIEDQSEDSTHGRRTSVSQRAASSIYEAGLVALCLASLQEESRLFNKQRKSWRELESSYKQSLINLCEGKYSPPLIQTLKEMTEFSQQKRIKSETLLKRLQMYQGDILAKKEFGAGFTDARYDDQMKQFYVESTSLRKSKVNQRAIQDLVFPSSIIRKGERLNYSEDRQAVNLGEDYLTIL